MMIEKSTQNQGLRLLVILIAGAAAIYMAINMGDPHPASGPDSHVIPAETNQSPAPSQKLDANDPDVQRVNKMLPQAIRRAWAKEYENRLLDKGIECTVKTSGKDDTTLTLESPFASKVLGHQIDEDQGVLNEAFKAGFKKFVLSTGYRDVMAWDLK